MELSYVVDIEPANEKVLDECRRKWNKQNQTNYTTRQYLTYILNRWFEKKKDEWPYEKTNRENSN